MQKSREKEERKKKKKKEIVIKAISELLLLHTPLLYGGDTERNLKMLQNDIYGC